MKRRPTIQFLNWKIALDLEETERVKSSKDVPAYDCQCEDCETWRSSYRKVLPENILKQLTRLKINMEQPSDVYKFGCVYRVSYHCVGRILSEPSVFQVDENGKEVRSYTLLEQDPYLSIIVHKQSKLIYQDKPCFEKLGNSELIRVEFILNVENEAKAKGNF